MSIIPKTVQKNYVKKSEIIQNETVNPEKKCKSLMVTNRVYMQKGGVAYAFPLYRDSDVGIDSRNGAFINDLKVDEDCESTNSIVKYGVMLCQEDLKEYLRDSELSQSDLSYD